MDQALDDVLGLLHEIEADLLHFDLVSGDPNYCEILVQNIQVRSLRENVKNNNNNNNNNNKKYVLWNMVSAP